MKISTKINLKDFRRLNLHVYINFIRKIINACSNTGSATKCKMMFYYLLHLLFLHLRRFTHPGKVLHRNPFNILYGWNISISSMCSTWQWLKKNHRLLILQLLMKIKVPAISNSGPVGTLCRQYCHKKKLMVLTPDFTRNWFSLLQTRWVPRETMADGLLCIWARDESSLSVSLYLYIYRYICLMMTI